MKDIFLINYSVKGIKTLDKSITLSFYKKIISKNINTREYNVKGIYGMNGSGKSGIVNSVEILKNIIVNPLYLNNPIVQKKLDAIINKKSEELLIESDFIKIIDRVLIYFSYKITLSRNKMGKYSISHEKLSSRKATSKNDSMDVIYEVTDGEIDYICDKDDTEFFDKFLMKTINLLDSKSMCALFYEKILSSESNYNVNSENRAIMSLSALLSFGNKLHVYLDQSDDHGEYFVKNTLQTMEKHNSSDMNMLADFCFGMNAERLNVISISENIMPKEMYGYFESMVKNLYEFIHIFKTDLKDIEIDKKEDHDVYICNLIMVYDFYKINAEFESTGIKKLIRLYAYIRKIVQGEIVFIDEFDSNLHDVYLCALLEYLMEYADGQLCFTTHNVGPMDILKKHKKSIDFLSADGMIYPWVTNGNYSPSKLYRNGMIEGSPFNVDSIDFIGIFGLNEEE